MRGAGPFLSLTLLLGTAATAAQDDAGLERVLYSESDAVTVVRDLPYARYGDRELKLDLFRPAERGAEPLPAIVVIRGGGWRAGDKEAFAPIAERLAIGGLAAASIEYRTSSEAIFPAAVNDVKAAVRWLRANAAVLGLDPGAIGAIGGSAGGHLAAVLATTHRLDELDGDGGNADASNRVQAVVAMAPAVDFLADFASAEPGSGEDVSALDLFLGVARTDHPELWALASPITHVHRGAAPMLMLHSDIDGAVAHRQSEAMLARYQAEGAVAELVTIVGAPHAFWNWSRWFDDVMQRSVEFFQRYLARH